MSLSTVAHLNFTGDARRALEFYRSVFGGQLMIATYRDVGVPQDSPHSDRAVFAPVAADAPEADHVAFGMVAAEDGFRIAAYDVFGGHGGGPAGPTAPTAPSGRAHGLTHTESFFVLLNGDSLDEIAPRWEKLADGGTVIQALAPSSWAPAYGMLTDRFGVTWILGVTPG
jgi:PhnB protein